MSAIANLSTFSMPEVIFWARANLPKLEALVEDALNFKLIGRYHDYRITVTPSSRRDYITCVAQFKEFEADGTHLPIATLFDGVLTADTWGHIVKAIQVADAADTH